MFPILIEQQNKRRGRPCAIERYNNEIIQQKLTHLINSNDEFARNNVMPFIIKRQRRARANDRERNRMQTLNEALNELKQHLPVEFLLAAESSNLDDSNVTDESSLSNKKSKRKSPEEKLTKIDTLRLATKYISLLTSMLNESESSESSSTTSPVSTCSNQSLNQSCSSMNYNYNYYFNSTANQYQTNSSYFLSNEQKEKQIQSSNYYYNNQNCQLFQTNISNQNNTFNNNYSTQINSNTFRYF